MRAILRVVLLVLASAANLLSDTLQAAPCGPYPFGC